MQEIGESREAWGRDVWEGAQKFAESMRSEERPFYIVFAAKPDVGRPGTFRQAFKAYYHRPAPLLGILVWFVDHRQAKFEFLPELSSPPDIPLDQSLLSTRPEDFAPGIAARGKSLNVLVS